MINIIACDIHQYVKKIAESESPMGVAIDLIEIDFYKFSFDDILQVTKYFKPNK